jgi:hypothetical protein
MVPKSIKGYLVFGLMVAVAVFAIYRIPQVRAIVIGA